MSKDLTQQWLTEIYDLKQKITELEIERNTAWESSEKWRKLYNTEAQQRRTDVQLLQQTISSLKAEINQIRGVNEVQLTEKTNLTSVEEEIEQFKSKEELKAKLIELTKERSRLQQALSIEQENHAQTKQSLTTALGDAIDGLTRLRSHEGMGNRE